MSETENCRRFKPLKKKLLEMLEANPLDFEHPPTQPAQDKPHPMCWVPANDEFPEDNPSGAPQLHF